jgi:hypothetical protein
MSFFRYLEYVLTSRELYNPFGRASARKKSEAAIASGR